MSHRLLCLITLKCLKDVLEANLKTAGYTGQRFTECCGKSIFCLLLRECSTYLSKNIGIRQDQIQFILLQILEWYTRQFFLIGNERTHSIITHWIKMTCFHFYIDFYLATIFILILSTYLDVNPIRVFQLTLIFVRGLLLIRID